MLRPLNELHRHESARAVASAVNHVSPTDVVGNFSINSIVR
jgi:hypothetical protein